MSPEAATVEPGVLPWSNEQIEEAASDLFYYYCRRLAKGKSASPELELADEILVALRHERGRVEHVIEVLRAARDNNGGYGFVRGLLEYLGAEEESQP